jgi:predicted TIM-barrel fold metal-dependent hydrolase
MVDMDAERIDAAFLYPTLGLFLAGRVDDPVLAAALCRAYNRWLADYCKPYPDRLFGVAMLPLQSVDAAVEEMRFARRELGMKAAFVRANPMRGRVLHDAHNDPIWREAEALDMSIAIHVGGGVPGIGTERFSDPGIQHVVSHTVEMMLASVGLIMTGVCERFPTLRLGFLESGGGWMPAWLDRMDRHFGQEAFRSDMIRMKPSEYFRRQCWISFEPVEGSLAPLAGYLGPANILWASDYPHADGFPQARALIERQNMPARTQRTILAESAIRFYNMGRPEALMAA